LLLIAVVRMMKQRMTKEVICGPRRKISSHW
jgi:hypothetical protein